MKHSAEKIQIARFDDLFGGKETGNEQIVNVRIDDLHTFHDHPFKVKDDEKMDETVESIKKYGVLVPGIVRPREQGGYEIISGHRRKRGSELAGLKEMPVMVRNLSDDEATIILVDANIQRENLDYSEKSYAFKMKFEAMKHQGSKNGVITTEMIGEEVGESGRQVQRYIRLTELVKPLLEFVDEKKIGFIPAVELSYLTEAEQTLLLNKITEQHIFPNGRQAKQLRTFSGQGKLTEEDIDLTFMCNEGQRSGVILTTKKLHQYFPQDTTNKEIETVIYKLLEKWKEGGGCQ